MKDIHEIVNRLMYSLGYKTKKSLAEALNISPSDLNNRINSGTVKQLLIDLAINNNINVDWLLTGKNEPPKIAESRAQYISADGQDLGDLIKKTTDVLLSGTKYGKALKENIEAFHQALTSEHQFVRGKTKNIDDPPEAARSGSGAMPKKAAHK